jgi:GTP-binding protein
LLHLVDISEWAPDDPISSFEVMRKELAAYDPMLKNKLFAVVGTKVDSQGNGQRLEQLRAHCRRRRVRFFAVSAITREGLEPLILYVGKQVEALRNACATKS